MAYRTISEFDAAGTVEGFFLIKSFAVKKAQNGSFFADATLADRTGEIKAKIWDSAEEAAQAYPVGSLVKIRGELSQWKGSRQLTVKKIRTAVEEDGLNPEDFVKTAPESFESMYREAFSFIEAMGDADLEKLVGYLFEKAKTKLVYYPAAMSNHHAIRTGLLYHILTMLRLGEKIAAIYPFVNRGLLYAGILVHDLAKLEEMESDELGIVSDYTKEGKLLGHIVQGILQIEKAGDLLEIPGEKILLLKHMVLSHHYEAEYGSPRKPMIPEAELLHYIDMIDARMYDFKNNLENTEAGGFSERVWTLDSRQLYKPERYAESPGQSVREGQTR